MPNLRGKIALVTGASRGIGAATAQALDAAGAQVILVGRQIETLDDVAATLQHPSQTVVADLAEPDAAERIAEACGHVDILVNNAAAAARLPTTDVTGELIDGILDVNVRNLLLLIKALVPSMIAAGGGSIINLSSVSGIVGTPNRAAYAASKGAVDAMTRSLAMEFGARGIRVNSVAPGVIDTELWAKNKAIDGVPEQINRLIPMRRWGTPQEVADVIVFLASDAARYVTAQTIHVDGGMGNTMDLYGGAV
jgi:NAD(P)-dependent dehydrogenase (short-subunit alcohol dehydrogenase family)